MDKSKGWDELKEFLERVAEGTPGWDAPAPEMVPGMELVLEMMRTWEDRNR